MRNNFLEQLTHFMWGMLTICAVCLPITGLGLIVEKIFNLHADSHDPFFIHVLALVCLGIVSTIAIVLLSAILWSMLCGMWEFVTGIGKDIFEALPPCFKK